MPSPFTKDQAIALSPDSSSVKAAQKLLSPRKWPLLEADDGAVWGHCQGSGKKPYQVQVDLSEPAFKCSCPSRKFPCKHGLALLILYAEEAGSFTEDASQPPWVSDWIDSRQERANKKKEKAEAAANKPVDLEAQAKRRAKRAEGMAAGLQDLELWLNDLIRQGLAQAKERPTTYWQQAAARLVDAKAPGLATYLRRMHRAHRYGESWAERMLASAGLAYLACEAFKRFDELPPGPKADLQSVLGWNIDAATVMAEGESVRAVWRVVGMVTTDFGQLRQQRTWLQSEEGRSALLLNYAVLSQPFDLTLIPGTQFEAEYIYYPSNSPQRVLLKERFGDSQPMPGFMASPTIDAALDVFATAVAGNPWLDQTLMTLEAVLPVKRKSTWQIIDTTGKALPISPEFDHTWELLAESGGEPLTLAGEWRNNLLLPLAVVRDGRVTTYLNDETDYLEF